MAELLVLTIFPGLIIAAAVSDIARFKIPNWLVVSLTAAFPPIALLIHMPLETLGSHALAGAIMLAVGFALFAPGYIGGGDAKLLAAVALWLGMSHLLHFLVYTAMFGGLLALALLAFRSLPLPASLTGVGWVDRLHTPGGAAPYGVAIGLGALIVFNQSSWISLLN